MKKLPFLLLSLFVFTILTPRATLADNWYNDPTQNTPAPYYDQPLPKHEQDLDLPDVTKASWMQSTLTDLFNSGNHSMFMARVTLPNGQTTRGAAGILAFGIGTLVGTKPASSIDYVAYELNRLHVPGTPTPAYAAAGGFGFNALTPVLTIWTVMRNVAYLVFAIIFIVIGIMIITRQKIDPKTVANIQNSLPKIILALVLVTFSYAIAGFLIDLMFVLLALIVTIMSSAGSTFGQDAQNLLSGSIFRFVLTQEFWGTATSTAAAVNDIIQSFLGITKNLGATNQLLGFLGSSLAFLIIGIAILVALFRTWLALLGAYAGIVLGVIFAPLQLMLDAIPGQSQFGNWLKNMLANLLAFPLVLILLSIGSALATNFGKGVPTTPGGPGVGFVPPLIGGNSQTAIQSLIGLGILLTIPKALDLLKEILKPPVSKFGNAWMEPLGVGAGMTSAPARGYAYDRLYGMAGEERRALSPIYRAVLGFGSNQKWWGQPPRPGEGRNRIAGG